MINFNYFTLVKAKTSNRCYYYNMDSTSAYYPYAATQAPPKGKVIGKHIKKNPECIDCRDLTDSTERKDKDKLLCRCTYHICYECKRVYNNTCGDIGWCMCKEDYGIEWKQHHPDDGKRKIPYQVDHCNIHPTRRLGSRCSLDVVTHTEITNSIMRNLAETV